MLLCADVLTAGRSQEEDREPHRQRLHGAGQRTGQPVSLRSMIPPAHGTPSYSTSANISSQMSTLVCLLLYGCDSIYTDHWIWPDKSTECVSPRGSASVAVSSGECVLLSRWWCVVAMESVRLLSSLVQHSSWREEGRHEAHAMSNGRIFPLFMKVNY